MATPSWESSTAGRLCAAFPSPSESHTLLHVSCLGERVRVLTLAGFYIISMTQHVGEYVTGLKTVERFPCVDI